MTDRLALGVTVGASRSVAVATAIDGGEPIAVVRRPSAVEVATAGPAVMIEGFLARVGDPVRMLAEDGSSHVAADLVAAATTQLIDEVRDRVEGEPTVVSCHPGWWTDDQVQAVRSSLDNAGANAVVLVPEPVAVVRRYEVERGLFDEGALVVYDLGASGLTVSVVRTGEQSGLLATPLHDTEIAGSEFDLLTMRYVLSHALGDREFDPFDPAVETELAALRERARLAREELSLDTATVVEVGALGEAATVRLVRHELEDLLRGCVQDSLTLVREAVERAGVRLGDITAVLLTGGGAQMPLVAELVSAEFALPVVACADPATASAAGAAELAADLRAAESTPLVLPLEEFDEPTDIAPVSLAKALPVVDDEVPAKKVVTGKRLAVVGAAVAVFGALTAGTLAMSPQFATPSKPDASTVNPTENAPKNSGPGQAVAPIATFDADGKPVVGTPTVDANGQPVPGAPLLDSTGQPIPGTVTPAAPVNSAGGTPQPGGTAQSPATQQQVQSGGGAPAPQQPAPQQPAPQQPAPQQPAPQQPAPQQPAPQQPAPYTPPVPQAPNVPNVGAVPGQVLDGAGEVVDGTVGGVTKLPGELLGGGN
ncbi:Hsp70 family protein [Nocardia sp. GTS18]|uniref:Hsp70 family protein n=1 Tax=Nocardia sp. GTS18 TaxID=1778064 RepID=UPI0015EF1D92|nr:Hsp70 family protein [Nocardia sp. GTS18]